MPAGQNRAYKRNTAEFGERWQKNKRSSSRNNVQPYRFTGSLLERVRLLLKRVLRNANRVRLADCHQQK